MLGFLLAVLVAVGLEAVLRMTAHQRRCRAGHRTDPAEPAVALLSLSGRGRCWLAATVVVWRAMRPRCGRCGGPDGGHTTRRPVGYASSCNWRSACRRQPPRLVVAALVWAARRRWRRAGSVRVARRARLMALVAGQALSYVVPYWPRVDRETFYPVTDVHRSSSPTSVTSAMSAPTPPCRRHRLGRNGCGRSSGHTFVNAAIRRDGPCRAGPTADRRIPRISFIGCRSSSRPRARSLTGSARGTS